MRGWHSMTAAATTVLVHHGHHVDQKSVGEGIVFYVVREHSDGMVGGRGSNRSGLTARAEIDRCVLDGSVWRCGLREGSELRYTSHVEQAMVDRMEAGR